MHRCWALLIEVGLYTLLLGPTCRNWALCPVIGPYLSRLGRAHHDEALCHVIGPNASPLGPLPCRFPLRLVVRMRWALRVVAWVKQPGWALAGHRGSCYTGGRHCMGFNGISWGQGKRDEREWAMSRGLFSQHTNWASHLLGLHYSITGPSYVGII